MKEFEIWIEGYRATGESSDATYFGKSFGETFEDAVLNFRFPEDRIVHGCFVLNKKGESLSVDKNEDGSLRKHGGIISSWACRYFDNETDARKSFG